GGGAGGREGLGGIGTAGGILVRGDAEQHAPDLQLGLGQHSKILHLQLRRGGVVIEIAQGEHSAAAQQDNPHGEQLNRGRSGRPPEPQTTALRLSGNQSVPQQEGEHNGDGHHNHGEPVQQNLGGHRVPEGLGHHGHFGQGENGHKGFKQPVVDGL